jgi:hypothetical protein
VVFSIEDLSSTGAGSAGQLRLHEVGTVDWAHLRGSNPADYTGLDAGYDGRIIRKNNPPGGLITVTDKLTASGGSVEKTDFFADSPVRYFWQGGDSFENNEWGTTEGMAFITAEAPYGPLRSNTGDPFPPIAPDAWGETPAGYTLQIAAAPAGAYRRVVFVTGVWDAEAVLTIKHGNEVAYSDPVFGAQCAAWGQSSGARTQLVELLVQPGVEVTVEADIEEACAPHGNVTLAAVAVGDGDDHWEWEGLPLGWQQRLTDIDDPASASGRLDQDKIANAPFDEQLQLREELDWLADNPTPGDEREYHLSAAWAAYQEALRWETNGGYGEDQEMVSLEKRAWAAPGCTEGLYNTYGCVTAGTELPTGAGVPDPVWLGQEIWITYEITNIGLFGLLHNVELSEGSDAVDPGATCFIGTAKVTGESFDVPHGASAYCSAKLAWNQPGSVTWP